MITRQPVKRGKPLALIGWRELVWLPELGIAALPAKIDSGARTSSIHGDVLETFKRDGEDFVRFSIEHAQQHVKQVCEAVHVDVRSITSSNGETQRRFVIKTPMRIGEIEFRAEITLADRGTMKFPMLVGRSALRRRFAVDSGHSWLQTPDRAAVPGHKP